MNVSAQDRANVDEAVLQIESLNEYQNLQKNNNHDLGVVSNWGYFALFSYMYILQGVIGGIGATMPYLYSQLPDYNTMAIFNSISLPFSFKFLIAPFLQKYSFVGYGKRKTWFIISLFYSGAILFTSSFFTQYKYDNLFAILFILANIGMAFLDISVHAAMIKELKSPSQASIILCYGQNVGVIIGGFLMLKLTSQEFASSIGLTSPITTPRTFLLIYSFIVLIPVLIVHYSFKETTLESEKQGSRFSFCEIVSYYKVFFKTESRYFRLCIYYLFYLQGFNFFTSLYDYKLIEAGFSRNTFNTIGNIIIFPVILLTFYYAKWTNFLGGKAKATIFNFAMLIALFLYLLIVFPLNPWIIFLTQFTANVLISWNFFISVWMTNEFAPHALTGMFITFNASFANFGQLTSVHTYLSGKFGWQLCSYIGLGISAIIMLFIFKLYEWLEAGSPHVPPQIEQPEEQQIEEEHVSG